MADTLLSSTSEFLFLMRGADWGDRLQPDTAADGLAAMIGWIDSMSQRGMIVAGQPLSSEGRVVSAVAGSVSVIDGPFTETKEAVGGYIIIRAADLDAARAVAAECPVL